MRGDELALDLLRAAIAHTYDRSFKTALQATMDVALEESQLPGCSEPIEVHPDTAVMLDERMSRGDAIALGLIEVAAEIAVHTALRTALRVTVKVAQAESKLPPPGLPAVQKAPNQLRVAASNSHRHLLECLPTSVIEPIPRTG
jgi:hypothetical protein